MWQKMESMTPAAGNSGPQQADFRTGKYLMFRLGAEEFAVQVSRVREIMGIQVIAAVAQTPAYVKGVIILRGQAIPVVDLRVKFGLPEVEYTSRTCIIVAQIESPAAGKLLIGVIVDCVSKVLSFRAGEIEDTSRLGNGVEKPYLLGMAKIKGKVKLLLDIDRVLSAEDLQDLGRM